MESKRHPKYTFLEVFDNGTIINHRPGEEGPMNVALNKNGYIQIRFMYNGKLRYLGVHHLVADTFLPERPNETYTVDHIDRNKFNNCASNLRWASKKKQAANHGKRIYR